MADIPERQAALIAAVSIHDDALWWITHQNQATSLLLDQVARWLTLKQCSQARKEGE